MSDKAKEILDAVSQLYPNGFDGFDDSKKVPPETYEDYVDSISSEMERTGRDFTIHSEEELGIAASHFREKKQQVEARANARNKCLHALDEIRREGIFEEMGVSKKSQTRLILEITQALKEGFGPLAQQLADELPEDDPSTLELKTALFDAMTPEEIAEWEAGQTDPAPEILRVEKRQILKAAYQTHSITEEEIDAIITNLEDRIDWKHATHVSQDHPLVSELATALELSEAEVQALFELAQVL